MIMEVQVAIYKVPLWFKIIFSKWRQNRNQIQKICEWDPYTTPVIAEKSGIAGLC